MKHPVLNRSLTLLFLLALLLGLVVALPGSPSAVQASQAKQGDADGGGSSVTAASDKALQKFDKDLQKLAQTGGGDQVFIRLLTEEASVAWPDYVKVIPRAIPDEMTGLTVWVGRVASGSLAKLASLDVVIEARLVQASGPIPRFLPEDATPVQPSEALRQRLLEAKSSGSGATPTTIQGTTGWWDVGPGHLSKAAWEKGYTGDGVVVADIDSGVDFCHPDLYGTWKVYDVTDSRNSTYAGIPNYYNYYDGWPLALSPISNYALIYDEFYNGEMTDLNTFAYGLTKFADTRTTGVGETISFDNTVYTTTGTAWYGTKYHIGYHPDTSLEYYVNGERVGVLVVDEDGDDVFESVYVDLNNNKDFSDDARTDIDSPTACWDYDEDGYSDISGGLVYFIADGYHWPQGMDWWWNPGAYPMFFTAPGNGDLVAFMFDDPLGPAAAHGTLTASGIVGQGRIDGDPSVWGSSEIRPSWKPSGVGGMIQGAGKDTKIIAIGDSYINFEDSTETAWYFAEFGVDGYGDTNDGAQITSNSYGSSGTDNDEWDVRSRLLTRLNTRPYYRTHASCLGPIIPPATLPACDNTYGQRVAHVFSTGNGAPGYGTNAPPSASTAIAVGASTQMGSTGWDSISGPSQIVWGDVVPWSNRGPTSMAGLAPNVTADGAYAAGAVVLNAWGDGWTAWETWGGTSRSTPVAAGNLALIYDAFMQNTGTYPTWEEARELIMSGASDQNYDIFQQGAGIVNADKATDIAGGLGGLHVSPASWNVGDYLGTEYLAFAKIAAPGDGDSQIFNLTNYNSTTAQDFSVQSNALTEISSKEIDLSAAAANESAYLFGRPDYLIDVSQYAPGGVIPAGTVLMTAELLQPFDEWEPQGDEDVSNNNNWRALWYSHTDLNGNGRLWNDANANGAVNEGEQDSGEYVRFSYGFNAHTYRQVSVKDPLNADRWKDGIYLGLQHRNRQDALVPVTHLTLRITFYEKSSCDWLTVSTPGGTTVGAGSTGSFNAVVAIPTDTPYGLYECAIDFSSNNNVTAIPVILNVAYSGDLTSETVTLGGEAKSDTPYDNSFVRGAQDWTWRAESGDWRFFFIDQSATPDPGTFLIVKDVWDDVAPETDIDSIILGPTNGAYVNVMSPFTFNYGDFSTTDPATFGPYRLEEIARSVYNYLGDGAWGFDTATGGNTEYVAAAFESDGLHEVMQHTVRYEGDKFEVGFEKTLSTLEGPSDSDLTYTNFFTDDISFSTTLTHTTGLEVEVFGKSTTGENYTGLVIEQDPTPSNACDFEAGGFYTYTATLPANVAEFLAHVNVGSNDLDLFLYYDADSNGSFSCPAERITSSTNSAGTDDEVEVSFPAAGTYMVAIEGWDVSGGSTTFSWYWQRTDLDNTIAMRNTDLALNPSHPATFELYNVDPTACDPSAYDCNDGIMYVGFPEAPHLFSIPITVDYAGPNLESKSEKTVSDSIAGIGDELTYTINLTNTSATYPATGAMVTDTLPTGLEFGGFVSANGATYSSSLDAVLWTGDVAVSDTESIVFTATVASDVPDGTKIANDADVNNGEGYVFTLDAAETVIHNAVFNSSTKAVDKDTAAPGEELTYTVVVDNGSKFDDPNATMVDTLPGHTTFVSTTTPGAVYSSTLDAVLWEGSVDGGDSYTITFKVEIDAPLTSGAIITNTATVGDGYGSEWETKPVTTTVAGAGELIIEKFATENRVTTGELITFTVHLVNTGDASTTVTVTDTLPASLDLVGNPTIVLGPGLVSHTGDTITWTGTLESGYLNTEVIIRYVATPTAGVSACQAVSNTAEYEDDQGNSAETSTSFEVCGRLYFFPFVGK